MTSIKQNSKIQDKSNQLSNIKYKHNRYNVHTAMNLNENINNENKPTCFIKSSQINEVEDSRSINAEDSQKGAYEQYIQEFEINEFGLQSSIISIILY